MVLVRRARGSWRWLVGAMPSAALVCLLALSASRQAAAQPSYVLEYVAESACIDEQGFSELVARQLAEYHDAPDQMNQARVRVSLRTNEGGFRASFELVLRDGTQLQRELLAADCAEAAPALAFVLALALGGRDTSAPPKPASVSASEASAGANAAREARATPAPVEQRHPTPTHVAASAQWTFGVGMELGLRSGLGPSFSPVEGAFIELARSRAQAFPWSARLTLLRAQPVLKRDPFGTTEFAWLGLRADGCPLTLRPSQAVRVLPCLATHIGKLEANGLPSPLPGAQEGQALTLWLDATAALRLELRLLPSLSVQAHADAVFPLIRHRFFFEGQPDQRIYRPPALAFAAFVGLGLHFP